MVKFLKQVQGMFATALCFYRSGLRPMAIEAAVFGNEGLHFCKGSREPQNEALRFADGKT